MGPRVLVVADDLTGAADTGVTFVEAGAATWVIWDDAQHPDADVLAISTESRHHTEEEAVRQVRSTLLHLLEQPGDPSPRWTYKKIDSTLRGHPGAELATVMEILGASRALVAPAFPAQGRITRGGRHFVHGIPLAESNFGAEVPSSEIKSLVSGAIPSDAIHTLPLDLVRRGSQAIARALLADSGVWIADAETDADLRALAKAAVQSEVRLLCGSAGLAQALATTLADGEPWHHETPDSSSDHAGCGVLIVAASRHPSTLSQIAALGAAGVPIVRPPVHWFEGGDTREVVSSLAQALETGAAVLTTAGLPDLPGQGDLLTERLADAATALLAAQRPVGLALTGGDAAIAVSRATKARALHLHGAVATGIPWGTLVGGIAAGLPVVTKAGGFGGDDALVKIGQFLEEKFGQNPAG